MNKIRFILFGLLFGVAGFLIGFGLNYKNSAASQFSQDEAAATCSAPEDYKERAERRASMMIDTGDDLLGFAQMTVEEGDTVYSLLKRASQKNSALSVEAIDYGDIGIFVNSINGFSSGDDNRYWQYWVNNEYAQIAADKYKVSESDVIMWKFTSSRFEEY